VRRSWTWVAPLLLTKTSQSWIHISGGSELFLRTPFQVASTSWVNGDGLFYHYGVEVSLGMGFSLTWLGRLGGRRSINKGNHGGGQGKGLSRCVLSLPPRVCCLSRRVWSHLVSGQQRAGPVPSQLCSLCYSASLPILAGLFTMVSVPPSP
jgi:hypothetical protein